MQVIHGGNNVHTMLLMYDAVRCAKESEARGQKTRNVRNLAAVFNAGQPVITSFSARNFNLNYCKKEWLWYLGADKFDTSIEQHATMWLKLRQADGSYNSNYGQYIFAPPNNDPLRGDSQFWYVYNTLLQDPGSRRATIALLKAEHLYPANTDVVCTNDINFCIEDDQLHMTVKMRSNDVIFGFTNDAFAFHELYKFMYELLKNKMPNLQHGTYTHIANSMHVYERHFAMIEQLVHDGYAGYYPIEVPPITAQEASDLVHSRGKSLTGRYSYWLNS